MTFHSWPFKNSWKRMISYHLHS